MYLDVKCSGKPLYLQKKQVTLTEVVVSSHSAGASRRPRDGGAVRPVAVKTRHCGPRVRGVIRPKCRHSAPGSEVVLSSKPAIPTAGSARRFSCKFCNNCWKLLIRRHCTITILSYMRNTMFSCFYKTWHGRVGSSTIAAFSSILAQ